MNDRLIVLWLLSLVSVGPLLVYSLSTISPNKNNKNSNKPAAFKFPTKVSETTDYDVAVKSAFVRHVVLETPNMVDLAMQMYLKGTLSSSSSSSSNNDDDPFGRMANDISACQKSRDEGGKIGWIENPFHPDNMNNNNCNEAVSDLIPKSVIDQLFESKPKGGDILKLFHSNSNDNDDGGGRWHLCRIDDLLTDYVRDSSLSSIIDSSTSSTGFNKVITSRKKLKGLGTIPQAPIFPNPDQSSPSDDEETTTTTTTTKKNYHHNKKVVAKTYQIMTTGCQMNVADSERLSGVLENTLSLKSLEEEDGNHQNKADVVILNTCTIRDHAEQKVYDALGPYAARKRKGEALALVVAGCVAQQEGEALLRRVPEVDLVMGPQYVSRLGDLLQDVSRGHQVVATDPTLITEDLSRPVRGHDIRAWVNIIHGCNEHCTYCVVPGVRGVEQSRSMEGILQECLDLANAGYKEITLLGQNIDAYGRDMMPKRNFADLLTYLNERIPQGTIERIRYVTSHPRYFSDRVIDAVANLDKVCECFHMPVQSGDDDVLKNMRRGYTHDKYMSIIQKIKDKAPDASICGDIIVGFPGETDEAFQRTLELMEKVKFDNLNTFAYSPRPNTEAALWDNQIPEDVKADRLQQVQRLALQHATERSERYVGKIIDILVEDKNPKNIDQVFGRTRQGRQVFFNGNIDDLKGKIVDVKIVQARPWSLVGEMQ